MTLSFAYKPQQRVLATIPHAIALLEALNVRGGLRVRDLTLHRSASGLLHCELHLSALDALDAEQWAVEHSDGPALAVQGPLREARAGTLWFGQLRLPDPGSAYLRLELPFSNRRNPNTLGSFLTLSLCSDAETLDAWASEERERLARAAVERMIEPVIRQAAHLGVEAVALGLRAAIERLEPKTAEDLMGIAAPALYQGWIDAWARGIASHAPQLQQVKAVLTTKTLRDDAQHSPNLRLLSFESRSGARISLSPYMTLEYWAGEKQTPVIAQLSIVTGASLDSPPSIVDFLNSVTSLLLLQYRAFGVRVVDFLPPPPDALSDDGDLPAQ